MANSSIENVQEAESKAKSIVDSAGKHKNERITKAHEKAAGILAEAETEAKATKEKILKKAGEDIEKNREKGMAEAKELAKRIEKMKISKETIKRIGSKAAKQIIG